MRAIRFAVPLLLALVAALLLGSCSAGERTAESGANVLIHFDRKDYDRTDAFVSRFHEGKRDMLLAVETSVEGGPIVYDLVSDGKQIRATRDDSRDANSASPGKQTYVCQDAGWRQEDGGTKLVLSGCAGLGGDWAVLGFDK